MTRSVLSASDCFYKASLGTTSIVNHLERYFQQKWQQRQHSLCSVVWRGHVPWQMSWIHHWHCSNNIYTHFDILRILYSFQLYDGVIGACKAPSITSSPINVFGSLTFQPICIQCALQGWFNALRIAFHWQRKPNPWCELTLHHRSNDERERESVW